MPILSFFATLFLVALVSPNADAEAQSGGKSGPAEYAEAIHQALTELEAANYPEAREEFQRAHAIYPNARTLRGLGMVEFELRNYTQCVQHLEEALSSVEKPLDAKLRAETEALLSRAQRYVGNVFFEVQPPSATVTIDGLAADVRRGPLRLAVGEHTFEAQAPGRATQRRLIQVQGGARIQLALSLSELQAASPLAASAQHQDSARASSEAPSEVQPVYKKWWLWTTLAIVVAGGATAAALLLTREQRTTAVSGPNTTGVTLQTLERF